MTAAAGPLTERLPGWAVLAALMLLVALWLGPLPQMSRTAFSAHMLLHLGVVSVAAPLLSLALIGLDPARRPLPFATLFTGLAIALDLVVVWGWHAPVLHSAAARNEIVFWLQQLSYLLAGLAVWSSAFGAPDRRSLLLGIVAMFFTFSHMTMLGLLLALSPELLYSPDLCVGAFGYSRIEDQQFGGVLMATLGGVPHLVGGLALTFRLVASETSKEAAS